MTVRFRLVLCILYFGVCYNHTHLLAEPWLGNRFAQNCSACHAPGRINLAPVDRRCTLSCQGCHVNPSGGGLRSFYGKWNGTRWLRSFQNGFVKGFAKPAPFSEQEYRHNRREISEVLAAFPVKLDHEDFFIEQKHDRREGGEHVMASSRVHFENQIPQSDPYHRMDQSLTDAGMDIRFLYLAENFPETTNEIVSFMGADFGLRFRPYHRHVNLVYESRIFGDLEGRPMDDYIGQAKTRSLYLLIDDLPYNVYIMSGYYLPMIGNYTADHTSLGQKILAASLAGNERHAYHLLYKATSIGSAPNVPFINFHILHERMSVDGDNENLRGYAANIGLRFVSLGASVNYTIWNTSAENELSVRSKTLIHNLNGAVQLGFNRLYLGIDGSSIELDTPNQFLRSSVWTLSSKLRLWREIYATLEYANSNSAEDLSPGASQQLKSGLRAFTHPGVDLELQVVWEEFLPDDQKKLASKRRYLFGQIHLYY